MFAIFQPAENNIRFKEGEKIYVEKLDLEAVQKLNLMK